MTLYDLFEDWDDISYEKKIAALEAVVDFLKQPFQKDEELIREMLSVPYEIESEDYFGTEGLKF